MTWVRTVEAATVANDEVVGVRAAGRAIALFCVDGAIHATENICTHGFAALSTGRLDGPVIECPLHRGLFDVRTGEAVGPPCTDPARTFPVRVEQGFVHVLLE